MGLSIPLTSQHPSDLDLPLPTAKEEEHAQVQEAPHTGVLFLFSSQSVEVLAGAFPEASSLTLPGWVAQGESAKVRHC